MRKITIYNRKGGCGKSTSAVSLAHGLALEGYQTLLVDRAERRAKLLKRAGYRALPVAAGEQTTRGAEESARIQKVTLVRDGNVLFWEETLEGWAA